MFLKKIYSLLFLLLFLLYIHSLLCSISHIHRFLLFRYIHFQSFRFIMKHNNNQQHHTIKNNFNQNKRKQRRQQQFKKKHNKSGIHIVQ